MGSFSHQGWKKETHADLSSSQGRFAASRLSLVHKSQTGLDTLANIVKATPPFQLSTFDLNLINQSLQFSEILFDAFFRDEFSRISFWQNELFSEKKFLFFLIFKFFGYLLINFP